MKICNVCGATEFTKDGKCKKCRKAYMKKYRLKNADKIIAQKQSWTIKNQEKIKIQNAERCKKWRELNPEKAKFITEQWAKNNPDKVMIAKKKWLDSNRNKHNASTSEWSKKHTIERRINWQKYKARKLTAGGSFSKGDICRLLKQQKNKCVVCHDNISESYHIDHIMPLTLGGSNDIKNIQLLCPHCNLTKWNKHPITFMQSRGFLL